MRPLTVVAAITTLAFALACGGQAPPQVVTVTTGGATQPAAAPVAAGTPGATGGGTATVTAPAQAREYPGTAAGVCQRLQDCGCPPLASVAACTTQMDREIRQAEQMMRNSGMQDLVNAFGGGNAMQQGLYIAANSNCTDACSNGMQVNGGTTTTTRTSQGGGVTTRTTVPAGSGGTTSASWSINTGDPSGGVVSGSVNLGGGGVTHTTTTTTPSSYTLVVRSTDGEWVDIKVDGRTAIELRNKSEGSTTMSPGTHMVEVYEFMGDNPFARARITTGAQERITIGVAENQRVSCYDPTNCAAL